MFCSIANAAATRCTQTTDFRFVSVRPDVPIRNRLMFVRPICPMSFWCMHHSVNWRRSVPLYSPMTMMYRCCRRRRHCCRCYRLTSNCWWSPLLCCQSNAFFDAQTYHLYTLKTDLHSFSMRFTIIYIFSVACTLLFTFWLHYTNVASLLGNTFERDHFEIVFFLLCICWILLGIKMKTIFINKVFTENRNAKKLS